MTDLAALDATGQAELVHRGEVSPIELVDAAIERIEATNPQLNAVVHPTFEHARARAAIVPTGAPFSGVPFLLKDLIIESAGLPYTAGSWLADDNVSTATQELASRYQAAGFVVCGRGNSPEFGILPTTEPVRFGATRNPWDLERSAGGSSGGSAAAVAAGLVPVAHANDGGGSIRIPAAACGLVGLKPTRGRTTLGPAIGDMRSGMVVEHVVTRSVRDTAAVLDCTHGAAVGDPYVAPRPDRAFGWDVGRSPGSLVIGVLTSAPTIDVVDPVCVAAVRDVATTLTDLGHRLRDVTLAFDGAQFADDMVTQIAAGVAQSVAQWEVRRERIAQEGDVEVLTWALTERGRATSAPDYLAAIGRLQRVARTIQQLWLDVDVVVSPTTGETTPVLGAMDATPDDPYAGFVRAGRIAAFTTMHNVTGQPAVSLPLATTEGGLPIGIQLAGRFGDESTLLRLAAQLEEARPWAARRPAVWAGVAG